MRKTRKECRKCWRKGAKRSLKGKLQALFRRLLLKWSKSKDSDLSHFLRTTYFSIIMNRPKKQHMGVHRGLTRIIRRKQLIEEEVQINRMIWIHNTLMGINNLKRRSKIIHSMVLSLPWIKQKNCWKIKLMVLKTFLLTTISQENIHIIILSMLN
jgi:hypothetical protein